jgi:hypothetical protein
MKKEKQVDFFHVQFNCDCGVNSHPQQENLLSHAIWAKHLGIHLVVSSFKNMVRFLLGDSRIVLSLCQENGW